MSGFKLPLNHARTAFIVCMEHFRALQLQAPVRAVPVSVWTAAVAAAAAAAVVPLLLPSMPVAHLRSWRPH